MRFTVISLFHQERVEIKDDHLKIKTFNQTEDQRLDFKMSPSSVLFQMNHVTLQAKCFT